MEFRTTPGPEFRAPSACRSSKSRPPKRTGVSSLPPSSLLGSHLPVGRAARLAQVEFVCEHRGPASRRVAPGSAGHDARGSASRKVRWHLCLGWQPRLVPIASLAGERKDVRVRYVRSLSLVFSGSRGHRAVKSAVKRRFLALSKNHHSMAFLPTPSTGAEIHDPGSDPRGGPPRAADLGVVVGEGSCELLTVGQTNRGSRGGDVDRLQDSSYSAGSPW